MTVSAPGYSQLDLAVWRYGIICSLLHAEEDRQIQERLERMAGITYCMPDGRPVQFSTETLRKWVYRYTHGGLNALAPRDRKDKGSSDVPDDLVEAMFSLRKEHPRWTLALLLEELIRKNQWNGTSPSRSTLYRLAQARNLMRDPHREPESSRAFEHPSFGRLWMADFMHGPKVTMEYNKKRKTYLHAILDDSSRYIVGARFGLSENLETLIGELQNAIGRFGICEALYTDNGASYSSRHLKLVCGKLGMILHHTPPYRPQGRGKIERFFRRVREQFLARTTARTLDQLNREFQDWISEYHTTTHDALDQTPQQKRLEIPSLCRILPGTIDLEALFRNQKRCRVYRDGTIHIEGQVFEVPGALPNGRITAYYLPWNLERVWVGNDLIPVKPLDKIANARRFDHPAQQKGPS